MRSTLTKKAFLAERVIHRVQRLAADAPPSRLSSELRYRAERNAFRPQRPGPSADDTVLNSLHETGVALTTVDDLGLDGVMTAARPLAAELLETPVPPDLPTTHLPPERLANAPEIFQWGASDRVLDLLERYFEVPVAYHGVYMRRDVATERPVASNNWHLDMEDRKVIKVVVYLTDVTEGDGAFMYLPLSHSLELRRALGVRYKLGTDADMRRLVPEDEWTTVMGPSGSVLFSDTARLYHKGRRPERKDRVALFYDFTTRTPTHSFYCKSAMPRRYLESLTSDLGPRARDSVLWRARLREFDSAKHEGG